MGSIDTMAGREKARKVVWEMSKQNGYFDPDLLDIMTKSLPPKALADVLEVTDNLKRYAAASVKTLAQNLYSSSAKFVFELLQNCDDNSYTSKDRGPPSVAFAVFPDRIHVSCNEDGFTEANVRAICSVGQSSKKGNHGAGYTGEKGIGFKSVFMAADEVRIQSGDYAFCFHYPNGDSGLGMTTPIWTEHDEALDPQRSHFFLTLRRDGEPGDAARRQAIVREQFHNIHDTILLFMRKLQQIDISFYDDAEGDDEDVLTSWTVFAVERKDHLATVKRTTTTFAADGTEKSVSKVEKHYFMVQQVAHHLAPSENRTDLDGVGTQAETASSSTSMVILGFPMDAASKPVVQNEHIFAFLPVKQMGFKFLIQADFVTQANREDIVTTSERNLQLATFIANAFLSAVLKFREHAELRYTWMRYLPHDKEYPWGSYWQRLINGIRSRVMKTPVLRPVQEHHPHRLIRDSRRLPDSMLSSEGLPLLADMEPEFYLSPKYSRSDLESLKDYGLVDMSIEEWLQRVQHDLASPKSVIKAAFSSNQENDTSVFSDAAQEDPTSVLSRVAALLTTAYTAASSSAQVKQTIRQLELILRRDGQWTSAASTTPLYYPQSAAVAFVRDAILRRYRRSTRSLKPPVWMAHLQFLYQTHHLVQAPYGYESVRIMTSKRPVPWNQHDIYIAEGSPYGVEILPSPGNNGSLGLNVGYIMHRVYFENEPGKPTLYSLPWKDWLFENFRVRRHLRLPSADGGRLSNLCCLVAQSRPEKFLGYLQHAWEHDPPSKEKYERIVYRLHNTEVLCQGGRRVRLRETYLPLSSLKKLSSQFLVDEFFPWLKLETDCSERGPFPPEWLSLGEALGLGYQYSSVSFLLDVLRHIARANTEPDDLERPQRIYELYVRLQAEAQASDGNEDHVQKIRDAFLADKLLLIPGSTNYLAAWTLVEECVLKSPSHLNVKYVLDGICAEDFPDLHAQSGYMLDDFFAKTLGVPDCTLEHIVDDIAFLRSNDDYPFYTPPAALYKCLFQWQTDVQKTTPAVAEENYRLLKKRFAEEQLIYGLEVLAQEDTASDSDTETSDSDTETTEWYSPAQCLWATSTTGIPGMLALEDLYPDLHDFFVKGLGVSAMTAKMVYDKLMGPALSVQETKQSLEAFNALLAGGGGSSTEAKAKMNPSSFCQKLLFPVRMPDGGGVQLCRGTDSFALIDRVSLADAFAGRVKLLDFDLDQTRALQPLLQWAGLQDRGLSKLVKETTCIASDDDNRLPRAPRDRSIRHKARALLSTALAYKSPRAQGSQSPSLYALLRGTQTLMTDKITSELHLEQDRKLIKVAQATASFHLQDDATSLVIHVPRDAARQELCFNSALPERLCAWLMTDPKTKTTQPIPAGMLHTVQSVLCAKCIAMEAILDHYGIRLVNVPDGETDDGDDDGDADADGNGIIVKRDAKRIGGRGDANTSMSQAVARTNNNNSGPSGSRASVSVHVQRVPAHSSGQAAAREATGVDYVSLLDYTIKAAQKASIPMYGTSGLSTVSDEDVEIRRIKNWFRNDIAERSKKIGAAGELFVFELLSRLDLPGFDRDNWISNIRGHVRHHAAYANMSDWTSYETADIAYDDVDGTLTATLIETGYLASEVWSDARPHYYIEVKTTVSPMMETPFSMSSQQYERMQTCFAGDGPHETIYMIVRVFGFGAEFVGFRLLIDPESMRRNGELDFATDTWSVVVV